jgi:hypothetical protein
MVFTNPSTLASLHLQTPCGHATTPLRTRHTLHLIAPLLRAGRPVLWICCPLRWPPMPAARPINLMMLCWCCAMCCTVRVWLNDERTECPRLLHTTPLKRRAASDACPCRARCLALPATPAISCLPALSHTSRLTHFLTTLTSSPRAGGARLPGRLGLVQQRPAAHGRRRAARVRARQPDRPRHAAGLLDLLLHQLHPRAARPGSARVAVRGQARDRGGRAQRQVRQRA